jgi:hypothetical protein
MRIRAAIQRAEPGSREASLGVASPIATGAVLDGFFFEAAAADFRDGDAGLPDTGDYPRFTPNKRSVVA